METCNVLFTSAGRRVSLIRLFRDGLDALGLRGRIITADVSLDAPARFAGDEHAIVPKVSDPAYIDALRALCRLHDIRLLVPLIDTELHVLAMHRESFHDDGTTVLVSAPEVTALTFDKRRTCSFFEANGIRQARSLTLEEVRQDPSLLPVIVKPARGSGSIGVTTAHTLPQLEFFVDYVPDAMIQELVIGDEYTLDVLADREGRVRSVVPRKRIEVRAGEVSKGVTVHHRGMIEEARRVVEELPGAFGPCTVQCFLTAESSIVFTEINPRFGGGFPLSAQAGATFPQWILDWTMGGDPVIKMTGWREGMVMLRYDEAIYTDWGELDGSVTGLRSR